MKVIEILPEDKNSWFPIIFSFADSKLMNNDESFIEQKYVLSTFYGTSKLNCSIYYKPLILL